MYAAQ
jgi:hypothetical protein